MPAERRRPILIALVVVLLLCLVAALAFNVLNRGGGDGDSIVQEPTPTAVQEEEATVTAEEEPTATPEPSPTPEEEVDAEAASGEDESNEGDENDESDVAPETDDEADDQTSGSETADSGTTESGTTGADSSGESSTTGDRQTTVNVNVEMVEVAQIDEILKNGNFEQGFGDDGVGINWLSFRTDGGAVNFSAESADAFLQDGSSAQRLSIDKTFRPDQYGGIQQTVNIMPGETYTLTIHGQIRSGFGSVEASNYGYRVQYALNQSGIEDWRTIPQTDWIELPWPEQSLTASNLEFSNYTTEFVATTEKATLFLRGWNKWPDGTLGEYTFDSLSLVGPVPGSGEMVAVTTTTAEGTPLTVEGSTGEGDMAAAPTSGQDEAVDKGLPVTGIGGDSSNIMQNGRLWGAVIVLLLLLTGAVYKSSWRW